MTAAIALLPRLDRNGRIVVIARALRSFAFGLNAVALGLYLSELGLAGEQIGLVLSAALAGTLGLTVIIALWGDRIGRRRLLMAGSALMTTAAVIPVVGAQPLLLAAIALSGMVAVTSNESTGLQTVDQALLPQSAPDSQRTAVFALYNLVAAGSAALGALAVSIVPVVAQVLGLSGPRAYVPAFALYALVGLLTLMLHSRLDAAAETGARVERTLAIDRSRGTVARLSLLFSLDSLAGSLVVQSFLAYFFVVRFGVTPGPLGALFFVSGVLTTVSFPVAAWLSRRIGLVRTMVFTHIPSSMFLIAMAAVPDFWLAALLQLGRAALSSMDVPARQSYTMAVVDPAERTATAGVTSLARALAQVPGPVIAGALLLPLGLGVPLVATGVLKITYDLLLFALFRSRPAPEEGPAADRPGLERVDPREA
jgi:MFS family permease